MAKTKSGVSHSLSVQPRTIVGSRAVRRLRLEGFVPAVVYGRTTKPVSVQVNHRELAKVLRATAGEHALLNLQLSGEGAAGWEKPVLVEDVQHDPVDGHVVHVDFRAITLTEKIKVPVAIVFKGEPVGVKQDGGILEHFIREVEVECLPTEIPAHFEIDVSALTIGATLHVSDLVIPEGVRLVTEAEVTLASVQAQREEKVEEAAAAVTEPEVIREKKEKAEGEGEGEAAAEGKGDAKAAKTEEKAKK